MKKIISDKLDQQWKNIVMDGTKPPVNPTLRKQLNHVIKDQSNHVAMATTTTTNSNINAPLVVVIYFSEGAIPIDPSQRRVKKDNNDKLLSNQMTNMTLINNSSPPTTDRNVIDNSPLKVDQLANVLSPVKVDQLANVLSPVKVNQLVNVLSPINNCPTIIDDNLPSIDDCRIKDTSLVSDDDKLINDESIEDHDPDDDYLKKLKQENDLLMERYDCRIRTFETKIDKINQQLKKLDCDLTALTIQREEKRQEFLEILNEHMSKKKNKKQNQSRQKTVKRMKQTTTSGSRK